MKDWEEDHKRVVEMAQKARMLYRNPLFHEEIVKAVDNFYSLTPCSWETQQWEMSPEDWAESNFTTKVIRILQSEESQEKMIGTIEKIRSRNPRPKPIPAETKNVVDFKSYLK